MSQPDYVLAHRHCIFNQTEIQNSEQCGCFYCGAIFAPQAIQKWVSETRGEPTALCPECEIDAVIGSVSGYPIDAAFLQLMHDHWF